MSGGDSDSSSPELVSFNEIWEDFGVGVKIENLIQIESKHGYDSFIRFALIRSMDVEHLQRLLNIEESDIKQLMEVAYNGDNSIDSISTKIKEIWADEESEREREYQQITNLLTLFSTELTTSTKISGPAGVRGYVQRKLRLMKKLEPDSDPSSEFTAMQDEISNYANWQMFSLLTNDLVELFHDQTLPDNMIPTLRRIDGIDFFVVIDEQIYPFDLKTTYIPTKYYEKEGGWSFISNGDNNFVSLYSLRGNIEALRNLNNEYDLDLSEDEITYINVRKKFLEGGIGAESQFGKYLFDSISEEDKESLKTLELEREKKIQEAYTELWKSSKEDFSSWSALKKEERKQAPSRAHDLLTENDKLPTELAEKETQIDQLNAKINSVKNSIDEASLDNAADYVEFFEEKNYPELKGRMMESRKEALDGLKDNPHKLEHLLFLDQGPERFCNNNRMFILLGYEDHIGDEKDAALMKLETSNLSRRLIEFISTLSLENLREIRYTYKKKGTSKQYTGARATSLIITEQYTQSS